jgi:hypothetical protein
MDPRKEAYTQGLVAGKLEMKRRQPGRRIGLHPLRVHVPF